jgi:hypothetical protein
MAFMFLRETIGAYQDCDFDIKCLVGADIHYRCVYKSGRGKLLHASFRVITSVSVCCSGVLVWVRRLSLPHGRHAVS